MPLDEGWSFTSEKSPYSRQWREWVIENAKLPKIHRFERVKEDDKKTSEVTSRKNMIAVLKALDTGYRSVTMRIDTLVRKTNLSRSSVKRAIFGLENLEMIDVQRFKRGTGKRSSRFTVGYLNLDSTIPESRRLNEPERVSAKVHGEPTEGPPRTDRRFTVNPPKVHGEPHNRKNNRRSNQSTNTGTGSVFSVLTQEMLRDGKKLLSWFSWAVKQRNSPLKETDSDLLAVFSWAERALDPKTKAKNPVAVFASLVGRNLRENISQPQEDRARKRLNCLRRQTADPVAERCKHLDDPEVEPEKLENCLQKLAGKMPR